MTDSFSKSNSLLARSIFFKLFLIFLATAVILVVVIRGFFFLGIDRNQSFKADLFKNLTRYSQQLVDEIGTPPKQERANALAKELGVQFRVSSPDTSWTTERSLPTVASLRIDRTFSDAMAQVGQYRRHPFVILKRADIEYTIFFLHRPFGELPAWSFALLAGLVALVIGGSYFVVRRLIRPVHWLNEGVREIAQGHFDHQVPVTSSDELGELTQSFNEMGKQVGEMIRSRERLLLDVSHELRSPLTRMKVAAEFIENTPAKEKIQHEVNELETMVTELLESQRLKSHAGSLTLTDTDVVVLIQDVITLYEGQGPSIQLRSSPESLHLPLDPQRTRIAFRNLFENAIKFSRPEFGPINVFIKEDSDSVLVSVQDFGAGISQEDQKRIFEPFYRLDPSRTRETGGYGLGLSLVKKIMQAHGGDVRVSSEMEKGSTFTLTFPKEG